MNLTTITIAQTLKPIDDTRAFEKLACSLVTGKNYEVNIIGFPSKNLEKKQKINYHPLPTFRRLSVKRIVLQYWMMRAFLKQKPKLLIINSPELLIISILYKLISGSRLIYDIQENHRLNILSQGHYPTVIRKSLAFAVYSIEYIGSFFCDHLILAESCYRHELKFLAHAPYTVLENKLAWDYRTSIRKPSREVSLLFSGNLSAISGTLKAVSLYKKMVKEIPGLTLTIIGHAPLKSFLEELKSEISDHEGITLIGGSEQVPHTEIIDAIMRSHIGIVSYQINPSNESKLPTKIYEYLGLGLAFISDKRAHWTAESTQYPHCITVDFDKPDIEHIKSILFSGSHLNHEKLQSAYWQTEEKELLAIVEGLLGNK